MQHNHRQYNYNYQVGEEVMIKVYDPDKLKEHLHGPYPILETRTNGTVVVQQYPWLTETYNIRKITSYQVFSTERDDVLQQRYQMQQQFNQYA